jgi:hypothetical protein
MRPKAALPHSRAAQAPRDAPSAVIFRTVRPRPRVFWPILPPPSDRHIPSVSVYKLAPLGGRNPVAFLRIPWKVESTTPLPAHTHTHTHHKIEELNFSFFFYFPMWPVLYHFAIHVPLTPPPPPLFRFAPRSLPRATPHPKRTCPSRVFQLFIFIFYFLLYFSLFLHFFICPILIVSPFFSFFPLHVSFLFSF